MFSPEQFKPFAPNPRTKLGRAYLLTVKDCDGLALLATEAAFLRENPLLWLRGLSLYAANLDYLIRQSKSRIKSMAPMPGEVQEREFIEAVREQKRFSLVQEHRLHKIRARRSELVVEFGYTDIRQVVILGDIVDAFDEIIAAADQHEWHRVTEVAQVFLSKLTGMAVPVKEAAEPVVEVDQDDAVDALQVLLSKIRGEGRS